MKSGVVKFLNHEKMFGFIVPDDGNPDIYFRLGDVHPDTLATLEGGSHVAYVEQVKYGKLYAQSVQFIDLVEELSPITETISAYPSMKPLSDSGREQDQDNLQFLLQWQWSKRLKSHGRERR